MEEDKKNILLKTFEEDFISLDAHFKIHMSLALTALQ